MSPSRHNPTARRWRAFAVGVLGMTPVFCLSAEAERAVTLTAEEKNGYARLVAKWADGDLDYPKIEAVVESRVLVMSFPEPVTLDLDAAREALPNWVALARLDSDGLTARLALREQDTRVHLSSSVDLVAVDILPEEAAADPPDIVSPMAAVLAAKAKKAAAEAALPPLAPESKGLEVRGSDGAGRSRIAFYWSEAVNYESVVDGNRLTVQFDHRAEPDLAYLRVDPPDQVENVEAESIREGLKFAVDFRDGAKPNAFKEGEDVVVLDFASPEAQAAEAEAEREQAEVEERQAHEDSLEEARAQLAQKRSLAAKAAALAAGEPHEAASDAPHSGDGPADRSHDAGPAGHETPARDEEPVAKSASGHDGVPSGRDDGEDENIGLHVPAYAKSVAEGAGQPAAATAEPTDLTHVAGAAPRETVYRNEWTDPSPTDGVLKLQIKGTPNGMEIRAPWAAPAPAAVFARPPAVWIVFGAEAEASFDKDALPAGFSLESVDVKDAVVLRAQAPDGLIASARSDGPDWTIVFAPAAVQPERFLKPVREASDTGRYRIETPLIGAAGVVWFEDPMIGDMIAAAVAFGPASASTTARSFLEAELPATAHGLAIIPQADDVEVGMIEERIVVSSSKGMAVSSDSAAEAAKFTAMKADHLPTPGFIDFDAWGGLDGNAYFARQNELQRAAAARDPASRGGAEALLDLARFYVAHDLAPETLGALRQALEGKPLMEQEARFLALRGAANTMMGRYGLAEDDLSKAALRGDDSASIWRGYVAAKKKQWERANDFLKQGEELIFGYSPRWAAEFYAEAAEAALRTNELDRARQLAERAASYKFTVPAEKAALVLAELSGITEGQDEAFKRYGFLTKVGSESVAVEAELRRLDLGVQLGRISPQEAADLLESLRFRWRGDSTEMAVVGILADQYMRLGRFREALLLAQSTALREPDAPAARDLRVRLVDYFRRLYLDGEADRLDPIQALALFYEFKSLTPIGTDGDLMIRKLAHRLVAFDLLDPATELLQHQIDNRVRGQGKASIAVDLASIYLMDRQPDKALAAINASRQPRLPKALALERRLLEGAAHRDMGSYDHVIELLQGVEGREAASIRADAYWRDQKWAEAARELAGMIPSPGAATATDADLVLRTAIAGRMAKEMGLLGELNTGYARLFENSENASSFNLITSQTDISGAALSEAARRLADAPRVDAFAAALKARFDAPAESAASAPQPETGTEG